MNSYDGSSLIINALVLVKFIRSKYILLSCSKTLELLHILAIRLAMLILVNVLFSLLCVFVDFVIKHLYNYQLGRCHLL